MALAAARFGHLDVVVSNAGVLSANGRIHNLATEEWERAFRINLLGAVNNIRAAVAVMRPQAIRIHRPDRVGLRTDRVVTCGSVLRDQGSRDPAGEGGSH